MKITTNPILFIQIRWCRGWLSPAQGLIGGSQEVGTKDSGSYSVCLPCSYRWMTSRLSVSSEQELYLGPGCSHCPPGQNSCSILVPLELAWGPPHRRGCKDHRDRNKTWKTLSCKKQSYVSLLCVRVSYPKT